MASNDTINNAVNNVSSLSSSVTTLTQQGTLQNAATLVQSGTNATTAAVSASGISNLPGGQKIAENVVNNATGAVNALADGIGSVTSTLGGLAASAFSGGDPSKAIKDGLLGAAGSVIGGLTSSLSASLSPGASAALASALSSLTSGGGSTIVLPTVAINTFNRAGLTSLISNVLGNPKIPRPNLLGEIPEGAVSAFGQLLALRGALSQKIKKLNDADRKIAEKQSKFNELRSTLPAGSLEIEKARNEYESAARAPEYKALIASVKELNETIGSSIPTPSPRQENVNPFAEIEALIETVATNEGNQILADSGNAVTGNLIVTPTQTDLSLPWNAIEDSGLRTYGEIGVEPISDQDGGADVSENTIDAITTGPGIRLKWTTLSYLNLK